MVQPPAATGQTQDARANLPIKVKILPLVLVLSLLTARVCTRRPLRGRWDETPPALLSQQTSRLLRNNRHAHRDSRPVRRQRGLGDPESLSSAAAVFRKRGKVGDHPRPEAEAVPAARSPPHLEIIEGGSTRTKDRLSGRDCPVARHRSSASVEDAYRSTILVDASDVWARLQEAESARDKCPSDFCCKGNHVHNYRGGDLAEEMSGVQGAVVVRRPYLTEQAARNLLSVSGLDFVKTLQSYFDISESTLLRGMLDAHALNKTSTTPTYQAYRTLLDIGYFLDAVIDGNRAAGELLTPYCTGVGGDGRERMIEDCLRTPTVVGMADVYLNAEGYIWNDIDFVAPVSCNNRGAAPTESPGPEAPRFEKVFVMTQEWGPNHYHFVAEHLPRIMVMLDVLLKDEGIKIAIHQHGQHDRYHDERKVYEAHLELLEILGISRERVVAVAEPIHADLAILPTSTNCGDPDTILINMLRISLLQGLYPSTGGVPLFPPQPVIVLVVRTAIRGLSNSQQVKEALQLHFPGYEVVEFHGTGSLREQLETFASAALIVGPHGAGLTNMVVAPLHTPVLEIASIRCPPCYVRMALKLQHIYARHTGGDNIRGCNDVWLEPDTDEVVELVRHLLKAKRQADAAEL